MDLLKDKICFVTGCSRGIGKATIEQFAKEGAVVYANARTEGSIDTECARLSETSANQVIPLYFDVRDEAAAIKAFSRIRKEQGRLDVMVNNAGIMRDALIGTIDQGMIEDVFSVNVYAVMKMLQMAAKLMRRQKSGSIVNLSSIVGVEGNVGQLVYSASKGAVAAMTKTAAKELAMDNIRVNAVAPGMIDTDMFRSIGEDHMNEHLKNIRMGRFGSPEEVAKAIVFLASDMSQYITGEILGVNGSVML